MDDLQSLDDPRLREAVIGMQLVGDDGANTTPADALVSRGIMADVRRFMVYENYDDAAPQSSLFEAVARSDIEVAIAWGPTAGYFASREPVPLSITSVTPWLNGPTRPMVFDISMTVAKDNRALSRELDRALERNTAAIAGVLAVYGVPVDGTQ